MSGEDSTDTTVLHVRHFPADLHKHARMRALEDGVTLREFVITALRDYLEDSE